MDSHHKKSGVKIMQHTKKSFGNSRRLYQFKKNCFAGIVNRMNDFKIRKKLYLLYIGCVLLPLILTDSIIIALVINTDRSSVQHEFENIASSVQYNLNASIESAVSTAKSIYVNPYIYSFLEEQYSSDLEYFIGYWNLTSRMLFEKGVGASLTDMVIYTTNKTVLNGGHVSRINTIASQKWYLAFMQSDQDIFVYPYYDEINYSGVGSQRKICVIQKLDYYKNSSYDFVKLNLNYSQLVQSLIQNKYDAPVYVCLDGKILLSNDKSTNAVTDFQPFQLYHQVGYKKSFTAYGQNLEILVLNTKQSALQILQRNLPLILFLILLNAVLPWIFTQVLSRSFTERLLELSRIFENRGSDTLSKIKNPRGTDEIGSLMRNYNEMADTFNGLIQTVYKERLKQQEIDIARQKAELLALHSQINPHFLFNALETIRMHSLLKNETETAHMVERLAIMERQYTDWVTDFVTVKDEIGFAEAYLELQKYRFGKRLSYQISLENSCEKLMIPKLTILTFVENACVHGIESKSVQSWIFIRVYRKEDEVFLEIEDTGNGISEQKLYELQEQIAHASIDSLRKKGRVGMINACLRLQMMSDHRVKIDLESEEGTGTIVTVRIPLQDMEVEKS